MPLSPAARSAGWLALCLTGGDDYELLLAVAPERRGGAGRGRGAPAGVALTRIGRFAAGAGTRHGTGSDGEPIGLDHRGLEPFRVNRNVWLLFLCQALTDASPLARSR